MMGHGTAHPSNAVYGALQTVLNDEGYEKVLVGTMDGYPNFTSVLKKIKEKGIKQVLLMPLMLVAGDHAILMIWLQKKKIRGNLCLKLKE